MTETHAADKLDRLDLGERFVVAGVTIPLGLSAIFTIAGIGLQPSVAGIVLGVVSTVVLVVLGNWLYQGNRLAQVLGMAWVGLNVLLGLALLAVVLGSPKQIKAYDLPGVGATWMMALTCLCQVIFGLFIYLPRSAHEYIAVKRGEELTTAEAPVEVFALADAKVILRDDQRKELNSLARFLQMMGMGLLGLAGVCVLGGILMLYLTGSGWSLFLAAILAGLLGTILRTPADDLQFLSETTGYETPHLTNTVNGLTVFCKFLLGVSILLALVLLIKLVF